MGFALHRPYVLWVSLLVATTSLSSFAQDTVSAGTGSRSDEILLKALGFTSQGFDFTSTELYKEFAKDEDIVSILLSNYNAYLASFDETVPRKARTKFDLPLLVGLVHASASPEQILAVYSDMLRRWRDCPPLYGESSNPALFLHQISENIISHPTWSDESKRRLLRDLFDSLQNAQLDGISPLLAQTCSITGRTIYTTREILDNHAECDVWFALANHLFRMAVDLAPHENFSCWAFIISYERPELRERELEIEDILSFDASRELPIHRFTFSSVRAEYLLQKGKRPQALEEIQKAEKIWKDNFTDRKPPNFFAILKAQVRYSMGHKWRAVNELIDYLPSDSPEVNNFAAYELAERLYRLNPTSTLGPNGKMWNMEEAVRSDPDMQPWSQEIEDRDLTLALDLVTKALDKAPHDPAFLDTLGWIFYRKGEFEFATKTLLLTIKTLQDYEENFPDTEEIFQHFAFAVEREDKIELAISTWELLVKKNNSEFNRRELLRLQRELLRRRSEPKPAPKPLDPVLDSI